MFSSIFADRLPGRFTQPEPIPNTDYHPAVFNYPHDGEHIRCADALTEPPQPADFVLSNPPFGGKLDKAAIHPSLKPKKGSPKTETLFLAAAMQAVANSGRAAVVVPMGVLFRTDHAHKDGRRTLLMDNSLEAVVSLPGGVFNGTSIATAVLSWRGNGETTDVWFYEVEAVGFDLKKGDPKPLETDIPDLLLKHGLRYGEQPTAVSDELWAAWQALSEEERSLRYLQPTADGFDTVELDKGGWKDWAVPLEAIADGGEDDEGNPIEGSLDLNPPRHRPYYYEPVETRPLGELMLDLARVELAAMRSQVKLAEMLAELDLGLDEESAAILRQWEGMRAAFVQGLDGVKGLEPDLVEGLDLEELP